MVPDDNHAPEASPRLTLEGFLPYRLAVLAARMSSALAHIYEERFDLTIPQWRVMATLGQFGTRTSRDIARHAVMHKSTVSRAVAALESRAFVSREPNAEDMREELIALTPAGLAIYEELIPEARAFEERASAVLSEAERAALWDTIERLDTLARKLAPEIDPAAWR